MGYVLLRFAAAIALGKARTCIPATGTLSWSNVSQKKMPFVLLDIRSSLNAAAVERVLRISAETWWIMGSKRKL